MKVVLQRVRQASLVIDDNTHAEIGPGLVLLAGFAPDDDAEMVQKMAARLRAYRVFADAEGRMNCSVEESGGEILAVPNFTLCADTGRGRRPGFSKAAAPAIAAPLFEQFVEALRVGGLTVASGVFGADMQVTLCNDGPVTLILEDDGAAGSAFVP